MIRDYGYWSQWEDYIDYRQEAYTCDPDADLDDGPIPPSGRGNREHWAEVCRKNFYVSLDRPHRGVNRRSQPVHGAQKPRRHRR